MDTLFLDANILFAATASQTGGSHAIFRLAQHKRCTIVSSTYAVQEAHVNIERKLGRQHITEFLKLVSILEQLDQSGYYAKQLSDHYSKLIVAKDLPILLAAHTLQVKYLITLDKKDFKTPKLDKAQLPFLILTPGEYLQGL